MKVIPETRRQH